MALLCRVCVCVHLVLALQALVCSVPGCVGVPASIDCVGHAPSATIGLVAPWDDGVSLLGPRASLSAADSGASWW